MQITKNIFFYEGDFVDRSKKNYFDYYQGMASSNFLVIKDRNQFFIDSGMYYGPHMKRIEWEMKKDNVDINKTKYIIFSHSHPDHFLFAKKLSLDSDFKIKFMMHYDNKNLIINEDYFFEAFFNFPRQIKQEILILPSWILKVYLHAIKMDFDYMRCDHFFSENDVFNFGTKIEAVKLFSHSTGHVGFYFPKEKIFYSGDLFDSRCSDGAGILVSDSSYEFALKDIDRVKKYDIEILIPGHGPAVYGRENVLHMLNQVKKGTKDYIQNILKYLPDSSSRGIRISKLTDFIFHDTIAYNGFSRRIIIYNCLKYLLKLGRAGFKIIDNRYHWFLLV